MGWRREILIGFHAVRKYSILLARQVSEDVGVSAGEREDLRAVGSTAS